MKRTAIAQNTLSILEAGYYVLDNGNQVDITRELASCLSNTKCYNPDHLLEIQQKVLSTAPQFLNTEFEVRNETTLMGAKRLARSQKYQKIGVLNFASAKNPGGGFIKGAQAQEESLARSSGLYKSLFKYTEHYDYHRSNKSLLYTDRMIYSPDCPVFKDDEGTLDEQPYVVDFITSPASNAGEVKKNQPEDVDKIPEVLRVRGAKLLSLAAYNGCDALVLGAWGCGVFRNEPAMVAQMFADLLLTNNLFWGRFKHVVFSVFDSSKQQETFEQFNQIF
ncbi:hypothetical protein NIES4071_66620 [Calothrix sp. NIES-4071]|nr:hypothetical protein NIES4071_66620 [Calothrix sp. NIES-4071]BAZ60958.1 hypothetical protein NIES4105_66580 [Calothrix sp. NIES-4105]